MAATSTQTKEQVSLKLLVNKETNKVLFAEAGKDFVDVLFSFLTLTLGTIARLAEKKSNIGQVSVGCLNKLYRSVKDLDDECLRTDTTKEILLQPTNSSENYCSTLKLNIDDTKPTKYFLCTKCNSCSSTLYLNTSTDNKKCGCGPCGGYYTRSVTLKHSASKGFVNGSSSFVITDNLVVMPNSMQFTSLDLLQNLEINGASSVKELNVNVTKEQVLDMLKCSLLSKTTLTDVFLRRKPSLHTSRFFYCDVKKNCNIQINVKLVIRKSDTKILYAQGEQDFADLLLSFLSFPLGGAVRVLGGTCSLDNIDALYKSIVNLDETKYLMSKEAKNRLVDPHLSDEFKTDWGKHKLLDTESSRGSDEGYVKGPRAYMATDDLVLTPWSSISALHFINHLEIPLNDLKEKPVTIGIKECLSILKASLISTSALTNGLCHLLTEVKEEPISNKKPKLKRRL